MPEDLNTPRANVPFRVTLAVTAAAAAAVAIADLYFLARGGALDAGTSATVIGLAFLAAIALSPALFLLVICLDTTDDAPSPARATTLLPTSLVAALWVLTQSSTFSGAGLRRTGLTEVVAAAAAFFVALSTHLILHRAAVARGSRDARVRVATAAVFLVVAAVVGLVERTAWRGQYPALHRAAGVSSFALVALAAFAGGLRGTKSALACLAAFLAMGAVAFNAVRILRGDRGPTLVSRVAGTAGLEAPEIALALSRWIAVAPQSERLDSEFAARFLERPPVDRKRLTARLAELGAARPDIVLVSIDTVRADHAGFLGEESRGTTPHWDALARESIVFERAYTTYPTSNFAYSSIFTSSFAEECPQYVAPKDTDDVPIAELLATNGWTTLGVTAFVPGQIAPGAPFGTYRRGFTELSALGRGDDQNAEEIADEAIRRIDAHAKNPAPYFLWIHIFDPHAPYRSWPGFDFGSDGRRRYASEIAHADQALGRIVGAIRAHADREAAIIVHSDHGESFGEHGTDYHNSSVYEEQVHVPLTISWPRIAARRVRETVSLADIMPTIVTLIGVADPQSERRKGRDLADLLLDLRAEDPNRGRAFMQLLLEWFSGRKKDALVYGGKKYVHTPGGFPPREVYDLEADPTESSNITGVDPAADARGFAILDALKKGIRKP